MVLDADDHHCPLKIYKLKKSLSTKSGRIQNEEQSSTKQASTVVLKNSVNSLLFNCSIP
jgi:hypothetical protein